MVAVKYFDGMSINRTLLAAMTSRLEDGGWPDGTVQILFNELEQRPSVIVMPLLADVDAEGELLPRSLQHRLDRYPQEDARGMIMEIGSALAEMHVRRVAHGNLKPGNIFFNHKNKVLLADWTLGNMPGVNHLEFTDALLYQPPEQLLEPGGYLQEAGYRWDVFAFGVLAYRLLVGVFPRCDDTFSKVAPAVGETRREGIHADLPKIARNLLAQPEYEWPTPPRDKHDRLLREWIDRCLHLEPSRRPMSMMEVMDGLAAHEARLTLEEEQESTSAQLVKADRKQTFWAILSGLLAAAVLLLIGLWYLANTQHAADRKARGEEVLALRATAEEAVKAKATAEKAATEAREAMEYEHKIGLARLEASRLTGDRLFSWAMEKGHRRLPPLDGRDLRLHSLEKYFEDFLQRTAKIPELEDERERVKLQLAEISLAAGESEKAVQRLSDSLEVWKDKPMEPDLRFRMAGNRLLLALLLQSNNDPRMEAAFTDARKALQELPTGEVDAARQQQLLAILDFHEANLLSARGDAARALNQLMSATQNLNRLVQERPDSMVLRSELAACYLSSATILEGMGNLGDAKETQMLATQEVGKLLKNNPTDPALRLDLAGCFGSMAEAAVLSGDVVEAEARSTEAIRLLQELVRERPDQVEAASRLASQLGLKAGLMRDRGETEAARKAFEEAIRMQEGLVASHPDNSMARYRLALLWWQKGKMLGTGGKRAEEVDYIRKANDLLGKLEAEKNPGGPPMENIQRSSGYLMGDLGHALELSGKKEEAKKAFGESASFWEQLLTSRPKSEEYQESLAWCRQRIKELE